MIDYFFTALTNIITPFQQDKSAIWAGVVDCWINGDKEG
ncbi:hypothetical protein AM1_2874 [Acaryochloris marina MBIC11017]|uniref:Uncharacterized protein n=1 Tax=Acaryochloris marina (strain MBIC 11017) TaxID=329726 RepID=B0CAD8_ACAM1|nr:hypothetical protein AM1_2874 [Acaryochloris marina MBIC11017]